MGINEFLKTVLEWIYGFVGNYGWAVVLFTLLVRLIVMPFDYKSRVGMRRMQKIAPMQAKIQKKYEKDPDKMNRKLQELYREQRVNPLSSCLPMLISFPILIAMFNAMRMVANEHLAQQAFDIIVSGNPTLDSWLWVKNVWMPDSPFAAVWPNLDSLRVVASNEWLAVFNKLPQETLQALANSGLTLTAESFTGDALNATIQSIYGVMETVPAYMEHVQYYANMTVPLFNLHVFVNYNGYFILPLLAAGGQFLMTKISSTAQTPAADDAQAQQAQNSMKFMNYFFPIFTLILCFNYNAIFALYWVASNVIAIVQTKGINMYLDHKEALEEANPIKNTGSLK